MSAGWQPGDYADRLGQGPPPGADADPADEWEDAIASGELIPFAVKWQCDQAATLEQAAQMAEAFAAYLRDLAAKGYELAGPVDNGQAEARITPGRTPVPPDQWAEAERGPCICEGRGGHTNPACPWYGTDQDQAGA